MSTIQDHQICITCSEEFLVDFNCATGESMKLGACRCDRNYVRAKHMIKKLKEQLKEMRGAPDKRKGGLINCPECKAKGTIEAVDWDYLGASTMVQEVECTACHAEFAELWFAVEWKIKK